MEFNLLNPFGHQNQHMNKVLRVFFPLLYGSYIVIDNGNNFSHSVINCSATFSVTTSATNNVSNRI